jgi:hypothetical protein
MGIHWDHLAKGGSSYGSAIVEPSLFYLLAERVLYEPNERPDGTTLVCTNYGKETLIHWLGKNRADVVLRRWERVHPYEEELKQVEERLDVECVPALTPPRHSTTESLSGLNQDSPAGPA